MPVDTTRLVAMQVLRGVLYTSLNQAPPNASIKAQAMAERVHEEFIRYISFTLDPSERTPPSATLTCAEEGNLDDLEIEISLPDITSQQILEALAVGTGEE